MYRSFSITTDTRYFYFHDFAAGRENLNPNISQKSQLSQRGSVKNTSKIGKVASTRTKANVDAETTITGVKKVIR
jgi:hypothetical protein